MSKQGTPATISICLHVYDNIYHNLSYFPWIFDCIILIVISENWDYSTISDRRSLYTTSSSGVWITIEPLIPDSIYLVQVNASNTKGFLISNTGTAVMPKGCKFYKTLQKCYRLSVADYRVTHPSTYSTIDDDYFQEDLPLFLRSLAIVKPLGLSVPWVRCVDALNASVRSSGN